MSNALFSPLPLKSGLVKQSIVRLISLQVESLQSILKDKTEDHASLLAANQQAQRDLVERNEEIDKLAGRIRELEQALLNSAESNRSVGQLEQELQRMKLREKELTQVRTNKTLSRLSWWRCRCAAWIFFTSLLLIIFHLSG